MWSGRIIRPGSQCSIKSGKAGIEAMQFGSGILSAEPPVDGDARCVALGLVYPLLSQGQALAAARLPGVVAGLEYAVLTSSATW